jgi:hypothetical protein
MTHCGRVEITNIWEESAASISCPKDGDSKLFQNVGNPYNSTLRHNPEGQNSEFHSHENLIS